MKPQGFTLVELIVVILLVGILSVFVAPRFFADNDFKARGVADEIIMAIRHAQRLSMTRAEQYKIEISPTSYRVRKTDNTEVRHPDGSPTFNKPLQANIVSSTVTIEFDAMGRPVPNSPVTINVAPFSITVEQETGYAHL